MTAWMRRGFEAFPNRLLLIGGHGSNLFPLLVQELQLPESVAQIVFLQQFLGLLAQSDFRIQILFEVQVPQLPVDLDIIVKILHLQVVVLQHVVGLRLGHQTRVSPFLLQGFEFLECLVGRFFLLHESFQILDDLKFRFQVLFFFLFRFFVKFRFFLAVLTVNVIKTLLGVAGVFKILGRVSRARE